MEVLDGEGVVTEAFEEEEKVKFWTKNFENFPKISAPSKPPQEGQADGANIVSEHQQFGGPWPPEADW